MSSQIVGHSPVKSDSVDSVNHSIGVDGTNVQKKNSNYTYVNRAYAGNMDSYSDMSTVRVDTPITSVVREQYWACSRWPRAQRVLAITVALLIGAVIGLTITTSMREWPNPANRIDGYPAISN